MNILIDCYLTHSIKLYLMIGLLTWLSLIHQYRAANDGSAEGIDRQMKKMALYSLLGWSFVWTLWLLDLPVFRWRFWTREVSWTWLIDFFRKPLTFK